MHQYTYIMNKTKKIEDSATKEKEEQHPQAMDSRS